MKQPLSRADVWECVGNPVHNRETPLWVLKGITALKGITKVPSSLRFAGALHKIRLNRTAQLTAVLLSAVAVKWYYSTASVNDLRWILAPTTWLVEFISGARFEFESYTGYMSSDRTFVIAASCAGVNFLITSFLMLSLSKLWRDWTQEIAWRFFALAALTAYLATLVANTVRISTALTLRRLPLEIGLSPSQLHRFEGIFIYFGFLLLLFLVSEKASWSGSNEPTGIRSAAGGFLRQFFFPLVIYYATTLGIPLANGAYRQGFDFLEHALFVLATPVLLLLPVITFQFCRHSQRAKHAMSLKPRA